MSRRRTTLIAAALMVVLGLVGGGWGLVQAFPPKAVNPAQPSPAVGESGPTNSPTQASAPTADAPPGGVDPGWVAQIAQRTGIPPRAVASYAGASRRADAAGCALGWPTLAAIGYVESHHGSYQNRRLLDSGQVEPPLVGIALNGAGVARIRDTDQGKLDGDREFDRAVGPMQFIPQTWRMWGADGNGDGLVDPHNIDDAAWSAARYLCNLAGNDLNGAGWQRAVKGYNNSDAYRDQVAALANQYTDAANSSPMPR